MPILEKNGSTEGRRWSSHSLWYICCWHIVVYCWPLLSTNHDYKVWKDATTADCPEVPTADCHWLGFLQDLWFINHLKPIIISGWAELCFFLQTGRYLEHEAAGLEWGEPYSSAETADMLFWLTDPGWWLLVNALRHVYLWILTNLISTWHTSVSLFTMTWNYADVAAMLRGKIWKPN